MFGVDIVGLVGNFQETQQESDQCIRDVGNAMDGRLIENNQSSNNRESLSGGLSDATMGLRGKCEKIETSLNKFRQKKKIRAKTEEKNWAPTQ